MLLPDAALPPDETLLPEELPDPLPPDEALPEELPAPLLPDDSPRSIVVLPTVSSSSGSSSSAVSSPEEISLTSAVVLPTVSELLSSSSLLFDEELLPPSRLENVYPAEAANDAAAELLYPVITSGDHPDWEPIDVTEAGIVIERIPLPENAPLSIVVSPSGRDKEDTLLQPARAPLPIIFVAECSETLDFPTGTIISLVFEALYRHPPSDAYAELPAATLMVDRFEHPDNALPPILLVLAGSEIADRLEQFAKALSPMLLTPDGIDIELRLLQPENAPLPIELMPPEIAMLVRDRHPLNVDAGIDDTDACMLTELSPLQPENTPLPMLVTLPGTVIFASAVQFAKALSPMLFTLPGILTLLTAFPAKAPGPMDVTSEGIVTGPPPPLYAVSTPPEIVIFDAKTVSHGIRNNTIAIASVKANFCFTFEIIICVTPSSQ